VPEGADLPKAPVTTILSEGTGTEVAKGKLIVVQFTAVDWTGKVVSSTWKDGPRGVPVGAEGQPSPFDLLEGVPVGSRVLLQLPPPSRSDAAEENLAVVIDILGQHGPAKEKA
jgi:peptidylprolyl isomerase